MMPGRRCLVGCLASSCAVHAPAQKRNASTNLAFETVAAGAPPAGAASPPLVGILLHGLLGSGRNWRSFARRLAASVAESSRRQVQVHLLDLRNHGASAR
jgi:pimeloyl-ACP methyl ester carboxylesterase